MVKSVKKDLGPMAQVIGQRMEIKCVFTYLMALWCSDRQSLKIPRKFLFHFLSAHLHVCQRALVEAFNHGQVADLGQLELKRLIISSALSLQKSLSVGSIESLKVTQNCDTVKGFKVHRQRARVHESTGEQGSVTVNNTGRQQQQTPSKIKSQNTPKQQNAP